MSRIDWSTAARGAQVIPVLLVHGMPAIFYPDGVTVSGFSLASADSAWWPGNTFANWVNYAKPWLDISGDGITISERAVPAAAQLLEVSELSLRITDVDLGATALFASEDLAAATYITTEISASAMTIPVVSTAGFASAGVIYLDVEAIAYGSVTSTSFTVTTRGLYGSVAARHVYSRAQGAGLGNPQVTSLPVETVGRPATLWLARIVNGVIVDVQLEHYGTVGTGPALAGGGESTDDGWVLTIDHAIKRLGAPIRGSAVSVGGYAHPGNNSARTTLTAPATTDLTPAWLVATNPSTGAITNLAVLTGDAAAPDLGGWHPTRAAFVDALATAIRSTFGSSSGAALVGDSLTVTVAGLASARALTLQTPCCTPQIGSSPSAVLAYPFEPRAMSAAWVPIVAESPVYLSDSDYASVPPDPTLDGAAAATNTSAFFALVFGDDDDRTSRKVARITGRATSGTVSYLTCTAITHERIRLVGFYNSASSIPPGRTPPYASGFVVSEPTTARLGLFVASDTWVSALKYVCQSLDVEYQGIYDAVDWQHMASVAAAFPGALSGRREYIVDLGTTMLSILQNEAALNGFALVMYGGRVSIARIAEFATTEPTTGSITTADLDASAPSPGYEKGVDGIVNTYTVKALDSGVTVNVTDRTSFARFGAQGTITATMPRTLTGAAVDASRLYAQVFSQGVTVLGPLRYPYRHVPVRVPLSKYDLQIGDLIDVELWRVPNGAGGRGITGEVAQIVGRDVVLYGDGYEGHVGYTLRLNPRNLQGYAPSALVAASGITGDVVTLDTTTLTHDGSSIAGGFAGAGYTDGGAATFRAGDLVRLVEIDTTSPTASTQHTVTAVTGSTLTLSPAPSFTFAARAASTLKVMVVYDDWDVIIAGANAVTQAPYAYLADATDALDSTHAARVFAA